MKNTLHIFLESLGSCVVECASISFSGIIGVAVCATCITQKVGNKVEAEKKRVQDELEKTRKFFDGMINSFKVYQDISVALKNKATEEKVA